MLVTIPIIPDDDVVAASNLSEDAVYAAYSAVTTYDEGDYAYVTTTHKVYRSAAGSNTGNTPVGDDGSWWVEQFSTNKWKCLHQDNGLKTEAEDGSGITYTFNVEAECSDICFFGLRAASVTVVVKNTSAAVVFTDTKTATETVAGYNWYIGSLGFEDIGALVGYTIEVTIADPSGDDVAQVGQIAFGYTHNIGTIITDTGVRFVDFSLREQDNFGSFTVTPRDIYEETGFAFAHLSSRIEHVMNVLLTSRNRPCVFWGGSSMIDKGVYTFGYAAEPDIPQAVGKCVTTVEVTGIFYEPAGEAA